MDLPVDPWLADLTPVLETALDAVVVMREDGVIAAWNSIAEDMFGWTRSEAVGKQLSDLIIPLRYREAHQRGLNTDLTTGHGPLLNGRVEISALHSSGKEFPVVVVDYRDRYLGEQLFLGFREIFRSARPPKQRSARARPALRRPIIMRWWELRRLIARAVSFAPTSNIRS